jgi:hypothetical protein
MSNINDSFDYTRFDEIFAKSMRFEQNGAHSPPFSQTIQAVLAIGRDSHRYARIDRAKKRCRRSRIQKWTFLGKNLEQKQPVFLQCTQCTEKCREVFPWGE